MSDPPPGMRLHAYRFTVRWYEPLVEPLMEGLRVIALKTFPVTSGLRVLDIGCGSGAQLDHYRAAGCRVFGIDPSPHMLALARRRLGNRAFLHLGDGRQLPFANNAFDLVVLSMMLHETSPTARAALLEETKRVMADETGRALVIDYNGGPLEFPKGHLWKAFTSFIEVFAGSNHFLNYLQFLARGALQPLLRRHGFAIETERFISGGNIGLFVVRATD